MVVKLAVRGQAFVQKQSEFWSLVSSTRLDYKAGVDVVVTAVIV